MRLQEREILIPKATEDYQRCGSTSFCHKFDILNVFLLTINVVTGREGTDEPPIS